MTSIAGQFPKGRPSATMPIVSSPSPALPERQKVLSEHLTYGPVSRGAFDLLPSRLAGALPSSPANLADALRIDTVFWIEHGDALERRFDAWAPAICRQQIDEDDDDYFYQPVCQDVQGNMRVDQGATKRQRHWPTGAARSGITIDRGYDERHHALHARSNRGEGRRDGALHAAKSRVNCAMNSYWASRTRCAGTPP